MELKMALYTEKSADYLRNLSRYTPSVDNAIGRDAGANAADTSSASTSVWDNIGNFFKSRGEDIENALGTTGAAIASFFKDNAENASTDAMLKRHKESMENVYKSHGFNGSDDYYNQLDAAEANGSLDDFLAKHNDVVEAAKAQAQVNSDEAKKKADDYRDYRENNYISKKINQDNGKFAGSAINTLSTAADLTGLSVGPVGNAIQGAAEGLAEELKAHGGNVDIFTGETSGWEDFSGEQAAKNAVVGAATGAVTGSLNKAINGKMLSNGGNLFKGSNKLTQALNNAGSKTALGRGVSTIATGVGRGAISGAAGGATGAAVSSALNGEDVGTGISNAIQGATNGALTGGAIGGTMAGANLVANKLPGINKVTDLQKQSAKAVDDWQNSGDNFRERLSNTWNSGDSKVANMAQNWQSGGNNFRERLATTMDSFKSNSPAHFTQQNWGLENVPEAEVTTPEPARIAQPVSTNTETLDNWDRLAREGGYENWDTLEQRFMEANPNYKPTGNDAGAVLGWMDNNPGDYNPNARVAVDTETENEGLNKVFKPKESDKISTQNKAQSLGKQLQNASKSQKYAALSESLDARTAMRAAETNAPETLSKMGVNPENYEEYAKTSNYVNETISDLAKKSGVKVNVSDLPSRLSSDNMDIIMSDTATKKYNNYIKQIVADGASPDEYSASYLLEKSRELGTKAANLRGNTDDVTALRSALTDAKYTLRDIATNALAESNITGDATNANIAKGLSQLGANQKVVDYYTAENADGTAPTASDYIRRSSLFEQARDMGSEMQAAKMTKSASTSPTRVATKLFRASGLEEPANLVLRNTIAPAAGVVTNAAGKVLSGIGNIFNRGGSTPTTTTVATPTTTSNNVIPASMMLYNAIGRDNGEAANEQVKRDVASTPSYSTLESMAAFNPTSTTAIVDSYAPATTTPTATTAAATSSPYVTIAGNNFGNTGNSQLDLIGTAMSMALADGDATAFGQLYKLYNDTAADIASTQAKTKDYSDVTNWNSADRTKLLNAQNGLSQINALANAYEQAGGGQGWLSGTARNLAGKIGNLDTSAQNYNNLRESVGMAIIKNLVNLGVTEADAERYKQYLPSLQDTEEQAQQKLEVLRTIYQDQINNLYAAYGL